jgi:hypothetical protein
MMTAIHTAPVMDLRPGDVDYLVGPPAAYGEKFTVSLLDIDHLYKNNHLGVFNSVGRIAFCVSQ